MGQYTFDDSGASFVYFLVALLAIYVFPVGIYYLRALWLNIRAHPQHCECSTCRKSSRGAFAAHKSTFRSKWFYSWLILLAIFLALAFAASKVRLSSIAFDPYAILGIDSGADTATIKRRYKQLSLEWHPDRNPDNADAEKKFIDIAKAYKVLTDNETRANWEKYGNPDGATSFSLGIALPKWLIDRKNMVIVLGAYGAVFGIVLPYLISRWWKSSKRYTKDKILNDTMVVFFRELKDTMTSKKIMEMLTVAFEFKEQLSVNATDSMLLPKIEAKLRNYEKSKRYVAPYCHKADLLLHAYLDRVPLGDAKLMENQTAVVSKFAHLMNGVIQIASVRGWLSTSLMAIDVLPMLVQACWNDREGSELLQLPHISDALINELKVLKLPRPVNITANQSGGKSTTITQEKAVPIRTLKEFAAKWSNAERRKYFVDGKRLSSIEYDDVLRVLCSIPHVEVEASTTSASADVGNRDAITAGGMVSLNINLKVNYFKKDPEFTATKLIEKGKSPSDELAHISPKAGHHEHRDNEDKDSGRKQTHAKQILPFVDSPYYASPVRPAWWIAFGQIQSGQLIGVPLRVSDLYDEKSIVIQFVAPPKSGVYALQVFVKCECFVGLDVKQEVKLVVIDAPLGATQSSSTNASEKHVDGNSSSNVKDDDVSHECTDDKCHPAELPRDYNTDDENSMEENGSDDGNDTSESDDSFE